MTDYRRYRVKGGTYFFTVNLAERKRKLLTEHIDALREAFRTVKPVRWVTVGWVEAEAETHDHDVHQ